MAKPDLEKDARVFAGRISDLLNSTICNGARLSAVLRADGDGIVAPGISKKKVTPSRLAVSASKRRPRVWLGLIFGLSLDAEGRYLMSTRTTMTVQSSDDPDVDAFLSFDYIRDPSNEFPAAHIHVADVLANQENLDSLVPPRAESAANRKHTLVPDLHIPVGGRRFRPGLEDLIEFLIREDMAVDPAEDWENSVEVSRSDWYGRQLRAAVRGSPDQAADQLIEMGYSVAAPET